MIDWNEMMDILFALSSRENLFKAQTIFFVHFKSKWGGENGCDI